MKYRFLAAIVASLFTLFCTPGFTVPPACTPTDNLSQEWWKERFDAQCARIAEGNVDLLLIGDSITHRWDDDGAKVLEYYYGDRNCVNFGIGGDQTGNVLWRLENAPMDKIQPKAAVLLIGINNLWLAYNQDPADVAVGTKMIVEKLESLFPNIKIIVLSIFPAGEGADCPTRARLKKVNALVIDYLRDDPQVILKDIGYIWLDEANNVSKSMMGDFVHPTETGYWHWAAAMEGEVSKILGDTPKNPPAN